MAILDWIIVILLFVGLVAGFAKGVIRQAFGLGGLILGLILGSLLYRPFAGMLLKVFASMSYDTAKIVAFVVILLIVPIVCGLVGNILSKLVHAASLGFIDRLLGAVFGVFKVIIIMGLIIKGMDMTGWSESILNREEKRQSRYYESVRSITDTCLQWTWNKVQENADDLIPDIPEKEEPTESGKNHKKV